MGKNRKAKQVVSQTQADSSDDGFGDGTSEVPTEFLTSDDFQVVSKKRHHSSSKNIPADGLFHSLPRSRSNSERIDGKGCYSGFWTSRSHQNLDQQDIDAGHHVLKSTNSDGSLVASEKDEKAKKAVENGSGDVTCESPEIGVSVCTEKSVVGDEECVENGHGDITTVSPEIEKSVCPPGSEKSVDGKKTVESGDEDNTPASPDTEKSVSPLEKEKSVQGKEAGALDESSKGSALKENHCDITAGKANGNVEGVSSPQDNATKPAGQKKKKDKKKHKKADKSDASRQQLVSSSSSEFSEAAPLSSETGKKGDRKRPGKKQLAAIHDALRKAQEDEERRRQEEETRKRLAEEAEKLEQERLRLEQEKKEKKKLKEKQKREKLKAEGKLLSKSQKQARARMQATLEAFRQQGVDVPQIGEKRPRGPRLGTRRRLDSSQSDSGFAKDERHKSESFSSQESSGKESLSDLPSSFDSSKDTWRNEECSEESDALCEANANPKETTGGKSETKASEKKKKDEVRLRSPVICVLGHVDTGKTKLLDYIRKTHVQDSEAGGITQQIGATMIPQNALKEKCKMVKDYASLEIKVPGLLVIDTPGHETFRNLRSRGSSVCDIAILVVDIMHGLEPQTLESISLLKADKIPFIVALNKVDRLYGWKGSKDEDVESVVAKQNPPTQSQFKRRCQEIVLQFANECLNASLYYENRDPRSFVSMVPVSAISGDGMGNLLSLVTQLTQTLMHKKLVFSQELQATVLEVKACPGLGTTIDVILVNGRLQEGDSILLASHDGPFVTQIRSLLMPQPLKELRVKNPYVEYKTVEGAQGVRITGRDLDKALAGLPLYVVASNVTQMKLQMSELLAQSTQYIKTSERGVYVLSSTLGSLEALLEYLSSKGVPYFGVKVGPVVKKDVMKASVMLEHDVQYAAILAFDVKVERDAQELADSLGVKVFHANIIYHLFDEYDLYRAEITKKKLEASHHFVFPCVLKIVPQSSTTRKDLLKVYVEAGKLYKGTPLCVPTKGDVGVVSSSEDRTILASKGEEVVIELVGERQVEDIDPEDFLVSRISKLSAEVCKEYFRDELEPEDWQLFNALKKMQQIHA